MNARVRLVAMVTAAMLMSSLAPLGAGASSWDQVDFDGSGWGHGVGMSQYGAYAMATMGKSYEQILGHYYKGTSVGTIDPLTTLWVNLESNFSSRALGVGSTSGSSDGEVTVTTASGSVTASVGDTIAIDLQGTTGCTVTVTHPGEPPVVEVVTDPETCSVDFTWYEWDTGLSEPTANVHIDGPYGNGCANAPVTCDYALGMLHLRHGTGGLDLSAEMLMDDYVLGISEVPYSWPRETAKAQAVAARSYAEARRLIRGNPAANTCNAWCHVKDTSSDQRYIGWSNPTHPNWVHAVTETANEVVKHEDSNLTGDVISAFYSSSSGGATEYGHVVGYSSSPVEWLTSVDDHWAVDGTVPNPRASWTKSVSAGSIAAVLGFNELLSVEVTETRPGSGSAAEVTFTGQLPSGGVASIAKTGGWVQSTFGLSSQYFSVDFRAPGDELFFYRAADGEFRYYDVSPNGSLGSPILGGSGYSKNWSSITAVDLDGDGQDEIFFYRATDGAYRYYDIGSNGVIGAPILGGFGYSKNWSSITAVDLDGDGQDEMFFYRVDGTFGFYDIAPNASLGSPINSGSGYSKNWSSITSIDLDGPLG